MTDNDGTIERAIERAIEWAIEWAIQINWDDLAAGSVNRIVNNPSEHVSTVTSQRDGGIVLQLIRAGRCRRSSQFQPIQLLNTYVIWRRNYFQAAGDALHGDGTPAGVGRAVLRVNGDGESVAQGHGRETHFNANLYHRNRNNNINNSNIRANNNHNASVHFSASNNREGSEIETSGGQQIKHR